MILLLACGTPLAPIEEGEWLPGGDATNTLLLGSNAFLMPAPTLTPEEESAFYSGNAFFNQVWVQSGSSTTARDGLGPLFNATSCSGCHFRDGRGAPPDGTGAPGALVRVSIPGGGDGLGPVPDPVYGGQIQDVGIPGHAPEAFVDVAWEDVEIAGFALRRPILTLEEAGYGPLPDDLEMSLRVGPAMIGLGLLEAIPEDDLLALEDPQDDDDDGISGRAQRVGEGGDARLGRFGWKAEKPDVEQQSAGAFAGDLGVTSSIVPADDCTASQAACLTSPAGGAPEVEDDTLARIVLYSRAVAVPVRRDWESDEVRQGKWLFDKVGCADCHVRHWETGDSAIGALEGQLIWPHTDLLLHDMGPELADERPTWGADGQEWRTPPLWGIGLYPDVNGHQFLLHDGRARGVEEAIVWHGGEGEAARDAYVGLAEADRAALVAYVNSL